MIWNTPNSAMTQCFTEPTEAQFLVVNALETLGLISYQFYNRERGVWFIETPSPLIPLTVILPNGDVYPFEWVQTYDSV
jgi:hypothetical protein